MTHISSIGAGIFSDLSVTIVPGGMPATYDAAGFATLFATETTGADVTPAVGEFVRVKNVREFPAMGTPPNIVNVPVYGQKSSQQIQGQSDAPSMELQLNFVASDWADGTVLGDMVGNGKQYVFRFCLMNSQPTGAGATKYASSVSGIGASGNENSVYYWVGKIDALQVSPQLTDANTATVAVTIQSEFYGAYTY